ncbi:MAG: hypothetical protein JW993_09000, partial [Sedimentisphaerales bacterium]|nr:hypothetical protein [Sedimentisphaerales bacterium]
MRIHKNRHSDENVRSLLSALDRQAAAPDSEFLKQLRERSTTDFTAAAPTASARTPKSILITAWRMTMKNPMTKFAAAAIVVLACLIGTFLWKGTGSGIALADVLTRLEQVTAYMYQ